MKLKYYVSILIVCFVVTSCLTTTHNEHRNFGDGSKSFKNRQSIESYKRNTLPIIERFLSQISQAGAGSFIFDGAIENRPCGENRAGCDYWSASIFGKPIDVNKVIEIGNRLLIPAGFSKKTEHRYENGDVSLFWLNSKDGGYVSAIVAPKTHIGISYISGCRPSDGSATPSPSPTPTGKLPDAPDSPYKTADPTSTSSE